MTTPQDEKERERATIDEIAEAIIGAMPVLDLKGQRVMLAIRRLMAEAEPVSIGAIARATGLPAPDVETVVAAWPGIYRDDQGRLVGFWGQAISPLDPEYRLLVGGKTTYAWCALDTLFIPGLLGQTVRVEASSPVTGDAVSLVVDSNGAHEVSPGGAVVSMVVPDGPFGYDVIESFCHRVLFFSSREEGQRWAASHSGTIVLSVEEAFAVGKALNTALLPDVIGIESELQ